MIFVQKKNVIGSVQNYDDDMERTPHSYGINHVKKVLITGILIYFKLRKLTIGSPSIIIT